MRINKFIAHASGLSRRAADTAIANGRVAVNGRTPETGYTVLPGDKVTLDEKLLKHEAPLQTIILNKPFGYVCSREGQGSATIYELLPQALHHLKSVGRLDRDSTGLLLMTNDGTLAHELTHPSFRKAKIYEVKLDKPLEPLHRQMISEHGVTLEDGGSILLLERMLDGNDLNWRVTMYEGRNRQIRRTFKALDYIVTKLHRTHFGTYQLGDLPSGQYKDA